MTPEVAAELQAIAGELARMPLSDRRRPERPHEIKSDLVHRLRTCLRREGLLPLRAPRAAFSR